MPMLLCLGYGFSAEALARRLAAEGWAVAGTSRDPETLARLAAAGGTAIRYAAGTASAELEAAIGAATHLLVSIPPSATGDPVLAAYADRIATVPALQWIGYLSTIGVYGDRRGGWVDESTPPAPVSERSRWRVAAEADWLALGTVTGKTVAVFRLAGIYGPGRNPLLGLLAGEARRIVKPGQVFNRIHVEDIATVLQASINRPRAGAIYNVTDDEPAPPQDVIAHAAGLLGVPTPPEIPFERAQLSPMAASFYGESKRVGNRRLTDELGVRLAYPTYREGLASLLVTVQPPFSRSRP